MTDITNVGVVGAGAMGAGIAEVCALGGAHVVVVEVNEVVVARAKGNIEQSMAKAVSRGKLTDDASAAALGRLIFVTDVAALDDRQLVIEAIIEVESAKIDLFGSLDRVTPAGCLLASNTSSIPIIHLAKATQRPELVLGMHFFNPAPVQPLVEIVRSLLTSDATTDAASAFTTTTLGKRVIHCKDRAGFVVNLLLVPYLFHAIRMLDAGLATVKEIDDGMRYGCAHPMGPLELCDLVGLDIAKAVGDVLYEEWGEASYAPPPLLRRMVSAGWLGRKTKRGFYDY